MTPPLPQPTAAGHLCLPAPQLLPTFHPAPSSVFRTLETLTRPLLFILASIGSNSTV